MIVIVFFFSSRRRHTRWPRDWSSDVCSSDLRWLALHPSEGPPACAVADRKEAGGAELRLRCVDCIGAAPVVGKPDVQHLASLSQCLAARARAVAERLEAAKVAARADAMKVPAGDRACGGRALDP